MIATPIRAPRAGAAQHGFTLLEVIVALVILSTVGLSLFGWISQNMATATRLRESQARSQLQLEGISWLSTINPGMEPEGSREMSGLRLSWRSTLIEPMRGEYSYGGSLVSHWMLGLYRVEASVTRLEGSVRIDWEQAVAGWKPIGTMAAEPAPASGKGGQ